MHNEGVQIQMHNENKFKCTTKLQDINDKNLNGS